jgi:1-acyl-sn-glycerol-3-phosphate acyltransferase
MPYTIFDTPLIQPALRLAARVFLRLMGWRASGDRPAPRKFVLLAAPHTSNLDFPLMMAFAFVYRLKIHWMGKASLFRGIRGPVVRWLGGIPVERSAPKGLVGETIRRFEENDDLIVVIPPEGTRGKGEHWKSGFYHIARGAGVPVVLGFVDYARKRGGFGPAIELSGDTEQDMSVFRAFYEPVGARHPERKSAIRLAP